MLFLKVECGEAKVDVVVFKVECGEAKVDLVVFDLSSDLARELGAQKARPSL